MKIGQKFKTLWDIQKKAVNEDGDLVIEGWANKNIIDSVKERVDPKGIRFERFKINPMILFNHNMDFPLGGGISWESRDEGLWIKAVIPPPEMPVLKQAFMLMKRGILKTFSIGFEYLNGHDEKDMHIIDESMLNEVSVVTLPCNMESSFSLAKKMGCVNEYRKLLEGMRVKAFKDMVLNAISEDVDSEETMKAILAKMEMEEDKFKEALENPTEEMVSMLTEELGLDPEAVKAACENSPDDDDKGGNSDPDGDNTDDSSNDSSDSEGDPEQSKQAGFEACVAEKIPALLQEGKPQEQAIAMAISMCQSEGKCQLDLITKENLEYARSIYDRELKNADTITTPTPKADAGVVPVEANIQSLLALVGEAVNHLKVIHELLAKRETMGAGVPDPEPAKMPEDTAKPSEDGNTEEEETQKRMNEFATKSLELLKKYGY